MHAATCRITGLNSVAIHSIITGTVIRDVITRIGFFVTRISGTAYTVIAIGRSSGVATAIITDFPSIAVHSIVAICVDLALAARIGVLVTDRSRRTRIRTVLAIFYDIAELYTVAEQIIDAEIVIRCMVAGIAVLSAGINSAIYAVIAVGRRPVLAAELRIAELYAVTEQHIVTR